MNAHVNNFHVHLSSLCYICWQNHACIFRINAIACIDFTFKRIIYFITGRSIYIVSFSILFVVTFTRELKIWPRFIGDPFN